MVANAGAIEGRSVLFGVACLAAIITGLALFRNPAASNGRASSFRASVDTITSFGFAAPLVPLDVEFPAARQERARLVLEEVVGAAALARTELKRTPAKHLY